MTTITVQCDVPPERIITVKLPDTIEPGSHHLRLVFDESKEIETDENQPSLMSFAGTVSSFANIDGVDYQRSLREEWH